MPIIVMETHEMQAATEEFRPFTGSAPEDPAADYVEVLPTLEDYVNLPLVIEDEPRKSSMALILIPLGLLSVAVQIGVGWLLYYIIRAVLH